MLAFFHIVISKTKLQIQFITPFMWDMSTKLTDLLANS
uniref:Uncharacterized protein n=1 Tax=Anguilla anguilla TaxID=7936 RepID=A0A0E9QAJ0_ANGAN